MTIATLDLAPAELIAEDLPEHAAQLELYEAAGLQPIDAFMLEAAAARIITIGRRGILGIGQELLQARARAQHGTWGKFLQRAGLEERTAQNYMNVAERFGDNPEIISALSPTALYALAAPKADPAIVSAIVEEVKSGAPAPKVEEVKQRLAPRRLFEDADLPFPTAAERAAPAPQPIQVPLPMLRAIEAAPPAPEGQLERAAPPAANPLAAAPAPDAPAADEEIAAASAEAPAPALAPLQPAAAPAPAPAALPPMLGGLAPAPAPAASGQAELALLVAKQALLAAALARIEQELAATTHPPAVVRQEMIDQAAGLFVNSPALGAAAGMLALSITFEA